MNGTFPWDTVLNIIFFAIGFVLGLAQLWQAQKFYLADQQNKFERINDAVTQTAQRLAVIEGVTNRLVEIDRALAAIGASSSTVQERLVGIVEKQIPANEQTGKVTIEASERIKELVKQEFSSSLGEDTTERLGRLEEKFDRVLADLGSQIVQLTQQVSEPIASSETQTVNKVQQDPTETLVIGDLQLQILTGRVFVSGQELRLTVQQFRLLRLLMERGNRLVSPQEILEIVFQENPDSYLRFQDDARINAAVARLRAKVDPDGQYIKTVRGFGYRLDSLSDS